jgi:excisionase family DNA binding protein
VDRGELLTAQAGARVLPCSDKEVYRMAASGEIACVRVTDCMVRFDPDELEKWLASKRRLGMSRGGGY